MSSCLRNVMLICLDTNPPYTKQNMFMKISGTFLSQGNKFNQMMLYLCWRLESSGMMLMMTVRQVSQPILFPVTRTITTIIVVITIIIIVVTDSLNVRILVHVPRLTGFRSALSHRSIHLYKDEGKLIKCLWSYAVLWIQLNWILILILNFQCWPNMDPKATKFFKFFFKLPVLYQKINKWPCTFFWVSRVSDCWIFVFNLTPFASNLSYGSGSVFRIRIHKVAEYRN